MNSKMYEPFPSNNKYLIKQATMDTHNYDTNYYIPCGQQLPYIVQIIVVGNASKY